MINLVKLSVKRVGKMKNKKFFAYEDDVYEFLRKGYQAETQKEKEEYFAKAEELLKKLKRKAEGKQEESLRELKKAVKIFEK